MCVRDVSGEGKRKIIIGAFSGARELDLCEINFLYLKSRPRGPTCVCLVFVFRKLIYAAKAREFVCTVSKLISPAGPSGWFAEIYNGVGTCTDSFSRRFAITASRKFS